MHHNLRFPSAFTFIKVYFSFFFFSSFAYVKKKKKFGEGWFDKFSHTKLATSDTGKLEETTAARYAEEDTRALSPRIFPPEKDVGIPQYSISTCLHHAVCIQFSLPFAR